MSEYESICYTNTKNLDKSDCPEKTEVKKHSVEFRQKESLLSRKNYTRPKVPTEKQSLAHSVNDFKPDTKYTETEMIHNEAPKKTAFRNKEDSNSSKSCCQNQEEILEEFKNSLNELIKASKWTRESQIGNRSSHIVSMHEPSFNVEENKHHERLTMRKSTTLTDHHAFNVLNFKNQTFSIDKSKSSEFFKLASNLPSDLNSSLYIQTPQVSKQTDSIGNQVVSPLSSSPSVLNTSLTYSSDSAKSSLLNIRSTSSNNLNDSSSSSSTTLQTQKQPKYEQNLLTSTKRFSKPKSVYLTKEDISSNTHANDSIEVRQFYSDFEQTK
ncbi:hypothetical protein BpHYR1_019102 [Brachionus plicatilis]|uniref:Uncharacterized protein n=1 Tax=Brachionus plicatilis TaxID=10195 RepID=A0A3M7SCY2_BRAPC|nr:hypothetical protein BpHYR1_019102 [Brachionus plicatilis]